MFCSARQISVCHIVTADMWAGAEAQIATLLTELSQLPDLALHVIALGEGRFVDQLRETAIEHEVIRRPHSRFLGCYREACHLLAKRDVQILHSHKSKENLLALLLARKIGVPFLVRTQHGLPEPRTLKHRTVYQLDRLTASSASRVISVSSDLGRRISGYVAPEKIRVIHNAINLQQVKSPLSREEAKRRFQVPESAVVIGTAARLEPVKRIDLFLEVARCLISRLPNAFFLIAGEGSERSRMQQRIRGFDTGKRVRLLGQRDDIYDVLRAMNLLLITSDYEGLPTVLLEAMALGIPVVSRKVGGIPEVIEDQVSGVLVDSADPLCLTRACLPLLMNNHWACSLARAARAQVIENFSAQANAAQVAQIYRSLACATANFSCADAA